MAWRVPFATALLLSACVAQVSFDVVGSATSIEGSWLTSGTAPSAASCSSLGIDYVRVRFFRSDGTHRDHAGLVFPCAQGSFDTRPDRVVAAGSWDIALVAIHADGSEVAVGPIGTYDGGEAGDIVLPQVDFTGFDPGGSDAAVTATWRIGGHDPDEVTCLSSGGSEVAIVVYGATDTARAHGSTIASAPCSTGQYVSTTPELATGRYVFALVLRDQRGVALGSNQTEVRTVARGGTVSIDLDVRMTPTTLSVPLSWQSAPPGAAGTCASAGVASMYWELYLGTASEPLFTASMDHMDPCVDSLRFSAQGGQPITAGEYGLVAAGYDTGMTQHWSSPAARCGITALADGDLALPATPCVIGYQP